VGPCFTVHGRLSEYNGSCVERIWVVGTKRLLAIVNPEGQCVESDGLPKPITRLLNLGPPTTVAIFGDYEVCPTTPERPTEMREVCLAKASHLTAKSLWIGHALPD
jgi:hypothetical protein